MRTIFDQSIIGLDHPLWRKLETPLFRKLMVVGVLLGVVALSLVAGYVISAGRAYVGLAIFGPLVALLAFFFVSKRFELIVLSLPIAALTIPFDLPTGTYSRVPIVMALALGLCGIWVLSMLVRNRWQIAASPINKPMMLFGVACVVSFIWGYLWRDPVLRMGLFPNFTVVQIGSLITYLVSIGAALLIGNFLQTEGRLKYLVGCFLFFGGVMTLLQILGIDHGIFTDRGLWGLWTVIPAYGLLIAQPQLRWRWRILLIVLIAANLYQTMLANLLWKSGWIPTIIAILAATLIRSWRWVIVMVLAMAVLVYTQQEFFVQMVEAELNEGADGRIGMWEINLRIVGDHWLFGTGPAGYAPYYMTYYPWDARSTHNNYLDIIAQFGLVGSVLWAWFAWVSTREGLRLYKQAPRGFLKTMALIATSGWIGAQASMFFGDWILPFAYNQTITGYKYTVFSWMFLGTLISLRYLIQRQQSVAEVVGEVV